MARIISVINLIILVYHLSNIMLVVSDSYCYSRDNKPYNFFAARTAYEHVHAKNLSTPSNCEIRYIWALVRHGTRYSTSKLHSTQAAENMTKIMNQIIENHEVHKRGKLCEEDVKNLKNWTCQWLLKYPLELTAQGIADMEGIATRLKNKFHSFFDDFENKFVVQTTYKRRCQQSAVAFTNKLFGTSYTTIVGNDISINDQLLYIAFGNSSADGHSAQFSQTNIVRNMLNEIEEKLGYEHNLTFKFINDLYTYCAYENAWFLNSRPGFCAAFSPEHLKIMEYKEDISDFYELGPSNRTAKKMSCPIVRDLYTKMMQAAANNSEKSKKGTFYFGHMETLLPTLVQLRLFHDEVPLESDNYLYKFFSNRKWRTSYVSPFGANLYVILFKCMQGFKISFYNNENKILIPGCNNSDCSMQEFQEIFETSILKDCEANRSRCSTPLHALLVLNVFLFLSSFKRSSN